MKVTAKVLVALSALVDKIDLDVESLDIVTAGKTSKEAATEAGLKLLYMVLRKLHLAGDELICLIMAYKGVDRETAEAMDAIELLTEIIGQEGVADFFRSRQ